MLTWMPSSVDRLLAELESFVPKEPPVVNDLSEQACMSCLKSPPSSAVVGSRPVSAAPVVTQLVTRLTGRR